MEDYAVFHFAYLLGSKEPHPRGDAAFPSTFFGGFFAN
jgi:hypothetical protein